MRNVIVPLVAAVLTATAAVHLAACTDTGEEPGTAAPSPETPAETPTPATETPASDDWTTYVDAELGFSFPHPSGLTVSEEFYDLYGREGDAAVTMTAVTFRDASGVRALDLGITSNPDDLSVQGWMDTYDPCASSLNPNLPQPESVTIAGESGVLCPVDQLNHPNPRIYFKHGTYMLVLVANVHGIPEEGFPPSLTEADLQRVVDGFSLSP